MKHVMQGRPSNSIQEESIEIIDKITELFVNQLPLTLTVMQMAKILNISRATAYNLVNTKDFPKFRLPGTDRILISTPDLIRWMKNQLRMDRNR